MLLSFIESEREYVRHLNILHLVFFEPLMNDINLVKLGKAIVSSIFPPFVISLQIFCRTFYMDIKKKLGSLMRGIVDRRLYRHGSRVPDDDIVLSDLFFKRLENFEQFYEDYATIYDNCRNAIIELSGNNTDFLEFLKSRRELPVCEGMSLENFLILPLHRLPFYAYVLQVCCHF